MTAVAIIFFVLAGLLALLAVVMFRGRGASLVAGYNTASPEKKAQIDEKKMLRWVGAILLGSAAGLVLAGVGALIGSKVLLLVGIGLVCVLPIPCVILMNTGNRCNKK